MITDIIAGTVATLIIVLIVTAIIVPTIIGLAFLGFGIMITAPVLAVIALFTIAVVRVLK